MCDGLRTTRTKTGAITGDTNCCITWLHTWCSAVGNTICVISDNT